MAYVDGFGNVIGGNNIAVNPVGYSASHINSQTTQYNNSNPSSSSTQTQTSSTPSYSSVSYPSYSSSMPTSSATTTAAVPTMSVPEIDVEGIVSSIVGAMGTEDSDTSYTSNYIRPSGNIQYLGF